MAPTTTPRAPLTLRSAVPAISREPGEQAHLEEDLTKIGCIGLISKPRSVKDKKMVRELVTRAPNQYDLIIRGHLETWSVEKWREAYRFDVGDEGFASRTDKFISSKFWHATNPKDGFAIADCEDSRAKKVLEFLIPILYLEKPTWVIVTVDNTIFDALLGERKVDWRIILQSVITKLVEGARKLKATSIGSYMFHFYMGQEVLSVEEMVAYAIGLDLLKYDCTLEPELDRGSSARSDPQPNPSV